MRKRRWYDSLARKNARLEDQFEITQQSLKTLGENLEKLNDRVVQEGNRSRTLDLALQVQMTGAMCRHISGKIHPSYSYTYVRGILIRM